jgi:hypothetical protein
MERNWRAGQENWGSVMGIDTTGLKIRGAVYDYLHILDIRSHDPLVALYVTEKTQPR